MKLPEWAKEAIRNVQAPENGKVIIELECGYSGNVTKIEIGSIVRIKSPDKIMNTEQFGKRHEAPSHLGAKWPAETKN